MRLATADRRLAHRIAVDRPAKLRRRAGHQFEQARTLNVSTTGALLEVESLRPVAVGEALAVAVAWDNGPVISAQAFQTAQVVRAERLDDRRQRVAVTFVRSHAVSLAA